MGRTLDVRVSALILSFLVAGGLVVRASAAAFSDSTANTGNQFTAGDVSLTDDDSDSAMFNVTNIKPGAVGEKCINVTFSGSLDATVKLYGAVAGGGTGLEDYLNVTVERSTGAAGGATTSCTGFVDDGSETVVYTGELGALLTASSNFATGQDSWGVTGGGANDEASYRFTIDLQDDNAAQGLGSTVSFTWEAQST